MSKREGDSKSYGKGLGCSHLEASASNLKRYSLGLRWGKKIKKGDVKRDDEEENNEDDSYEDRQNDAKRRKVCASQ